jgi:hypothetical protein
MEKQFKVHPGDLSNKNLTNVPITVPWGILNEDQAKENHSQTLTRLNERGGLGVLEMLNNIDKVRLEFRGTNQSEVDRLNKLVADYMSENSKAPKVETNEQIEDLAKAEYPIDNNVGEYTKAFPYEKLNGFIKGFKARDEMDGWISVSDRLPKYMQSVLGCFDEIKIGNFYYDEKTNKWYQDGWHKDTQERTFQITHWQPLPNKPKTQKE